MPIVFATFILVLLLVVGIYWFMLERPETREQDELMKRLRVASGSKAKRIDFIKQAERLSSVKAFDALLSRSKGLTGGLQRLLNQANMKMTVGGLLLLSVFLMLVVALVVNVITRLSWLALVLGVVVSTLPFFVVRYKAQKRLRTFEEQFPEAIDLVSRALRAGHAFTTGLSIVSEEAPEPVAGEFRLLYDQQNFGMPLSDALKAFAIRVPLLDARFFVTAVLTQRESGGNLAEILSNLANVIRERFKVKRQVRVLSAHGRITAWVLCGLPPSLALGFMITAPSYIKTLTEDPLGVRMIFLAVFLQIMGTLIIRRIVDIEY
jgi:tight adherence protein B